jgi:molybdenum cofactor biosynthesis enzyme
MLPNAFAWLAGRAAARASGATAAWTFRASVVSAGAPSPVEDARASSPSSAPLAMPRFFSQSAFIPPRAPRLEQQQQARAFSSAADEATDTAAAASTRLSSLERELSALNRELADVFGEPPPGGPAGAGGGVGGFAPASSSSSSSSSFGGQRPPPPPPPLPPPASPPSADALLSHVEPRTGRASMVDVSHKNSTLREARASCLVILSRSATRAVAANSLKKGDVLGTARLAGIMAAKRTSDLIPLCHPLLLSRVDVTAELVDVGLGRGDLDRGEEGGRGLGGGGLGGAAGAARPEEEEGEGEGEGSAAGGGGGNGARGGGNARGGGAVRVACVARVGVGSTGVEMEALTGASVAALTVYDMVKAVGKGCAVVTDLRLDYKVGGKGGAWARGNLERDDAQGWALMQRAAAEAAGGPAAGQKGGGG